MKKRLGIWIGVFLTIGACANASDQPGPKSKEEWLREYGWSAARAETCHWDFRRSTELKSRLLSMYADDLPPAGISRLSAAYDKGFREGQATPDAPQYCRHYMKILYILEGGK